MCVTASLRVHVSHLEIPVRFLPSPAPPLQVSTALTIQGTTIYDLVEHCNSSSVTSSTHLQSDRNSNSNSNSNSNTHKKVNFSTTLTFPFLYSDLTRDASLNFTVTTPDGSVLGGTTVMIFDPLGLVREGKIKTIIFGGQQSDGAAGGNSKTLGVQGRTTISPSYPPHHPRPPLLPAGSGKNKSSKSSMKSKASQSPPLTRQPYGGEMAAVDHRFRAEKIKEQYDLRKVPPLDWLDRLTTQDINRVLQPSSNNANANANANTNANYNDNANDNVNDNDNDNPNNDDDDNDNANNANNENYDNKSGANYNSAELSVGASWDLLNSAFLYLELPVFPYPVVFEEQTYAFSTRGASGAINPFEVALVRKQIAARRVSENRPQGEGGRRKSMTEIIRKESMMITNQSMSNTASPANRINNKLHQQNSNIALLEVLDWECEQDNPVEDKYRTLAHEMLRGIVDPELKPNKAQKGMIDRILISPGHHLRREEKDLLWRFRFSLVDDRKALTKFLLCVDWSVESEVIQTTELLEQWRKRSAIDTTDALKLLGKHVAFQSKLVRSYAVDTLGSATDEEIVLYLLQLVQALKYEGLGEESAKKKEDSSGKNNSNTMNNTNNNNDEDESNVQTPDQEQKVGELGKFLIRRACENLELANYLYWYLKVELEDAFYGKKYLAVFKALEHGLKSTPLKKASYDHLDEGRLSEVDEAHMTDSSRRKTGNKNVFKSIIKNVKKNLGDSSRHTLDDPPAPPATPPSPMPSPPLSAASHTHADDDGSHFTFYDVFCAQEKYFLGIMEMQMKAKSVKGKKSSKETALRKHLKSFTALDSQISSVPVPLCPNIDVMGVIPDNCFMFRSALYPAVVSFRCKPDEYLLQEEIRTRNDEAAKRTSTNNRKLQQMLGGASNNSPLSNSNSGNGNGTTPTSPKIANLLSSITSLPPSPASRTSDLIHGQEYKVIFKSGDDLRQDQLVICFIRLFDKLLKQEGLDMCLNPYSILATSATTGLVEFVDGSVPISAVLAEGTILDFFRKHYKCPGSEFGIYEEVQQTYIRSCAGYCVITYLLGIGDRHLDNIMLIPTGHFFHIDFGFIFGRDPKPMPPAFRLTQAMVDGFGDEKHFKQFKTLCCQVFNLLRRSAGLVINLLSLSKEANIPDLSNNPSSDADGVIAKVEEKFRLDLNDEQAEHFFLGLINDSINAFAPKVLEVFHQISVARR